MFSARFLLSIFDTVYLLCLVNWVGSILFFSFGVAPIIFKVLKPESAAAFVRALFPRYYLWGAISAAVALPAMLGTPLSFPEFRGPSVALKAFLILSEVMIMLYCGNSLTPAINAARDEGDPAKDRFEKLHKRSVRLNSVSLVLGLGLLIAFANRPTPRSEGIVEKSPLERAQYDQQVLEEIENLMRRKPAASGSSKLDAETREELRGIVEDKQKRDAARREAGKR